MKDIFRLSELGYGLASQVTGSEASIIKAANLGRIDDANSLVDAAHRYAQKIKSAAQDIYYSEKERGFADGQARADEARAAQILADQKALDRHLAGLESSIGGLVFSCVKQIIGNFDDAGLSREIARSALSAMRAERRGQLFVSTQALEPVRAALPQLLEDFPEIELVDVIEDPELQAPDVRLESTLGTVTFVLDETLESLRALLERHES